MKSAVFLTAASLIALSVAGLGQLHAATDSNKTPTEVSEAVSGGATSAQDVDMSEHGLAAMNDIHLARTAINDGYVDSAKKLLDEAHMLLGRVASEDMPVTVTTEVKVGDKTTQKETVTAKPDLIPILSELQVVEGFAAQPQDAAAASQSADQPADQAAEQAVSQAVTQSAGKAPQSSPDKQADNAARPSKSDRIAAVGQAREQLSKGDREGAIETLRLVDLGLVSRTLSMPLAETNSHVDKAIALLDEGKLHEANLELKQAKDGLVADTVVMIEPTDAVAPDQAAVGTSQPEPQASVAADHHKIATAQAK